MITVHVQECYAVSASTAKTGNKMCLQGLALTYSVTSQQVFSLQANAKALGMEVNRAGFMDSRRGTRCINMAQVAAQTIDIHIGFTCHKPHTYTGSLATDPLMALSSYMSHKPQYGLG